MYGFAGNTSIEPKKIQLQAREEVSYKNQATRFLPYENVRCN